VDTIISNCVINLSTDKPGVFKEAFRVLKPGGRLMVSDLVVMKELTDYIKDSISAYVGCLAGAIPKDQYLKAIKAAGFNGVQVVEEAVYPLDDILSDATAKVIMEEAKITPEQARELGVTVSSIKVAGQKPK
jgi:arsenite methyltransferase